MLINRWVDEENMVYVSNRISFSHKIEWNFAICSNVDGLGGHYVKWNKSDRERPILHDIIHVKDLKKIQKTSKILKKGENKLVVTSKQWEREGNIGMGNKGLLCNNMKSCVWNFENCKALWNLNNLLFNRNKERTRMRTNSASLC